MHWLPSICGYPSVKNGGEGGHHDMASQTHHLHLKGHWSCSCCDHCWNPCLSPPKTSEQIQHLLFRFSFPKHAYHVRPSAASASLTFYLPNQVSVNPTKTTSIFLQQFYWGYSCTETGNAIYKIPYLYLHQPFFEDFDSTHKVGSIIRHQNLWQTKLSKQCSQRLHSHS